MALQRYPRRKRRRQDSSDNELHIEEISPDDMGYDGDVEGIEVLQPDQYEDADSGSEDKKTSRRLWPDSDDELAGRLRRLSCDIQGSASRRRDETDRGQKRRSQEVEHDVDDNEHLAKRAEIEVSELVDGQPEQRPIKRRKKRPDKLIQTNRGARKQLMAAWSDSSDKTEDHEAGMESSNSGTPNVPSTPAAPADRDRDAMDIG
ncbi:hypothetical protein EDD37DRAFT_639137 [Exophiala viscosa]|uniref:Uncharacterized protein n=1 Tax=Exophiala viscosa TaxID=2486360 RepID=A0AAN6I9D1_9EURO|nr:hypothetical protein EDD36DRAFT_81895 [Exophiala viscosa]KAI1620848.1 hypothetical protein EDD37DRAFT_639137 [Exophiala viscosa]